MGKNWVLGVDGPPRRIGAASPRCGLSFILLGCWGWTRALLVGEAEESVPIQSYGQIVRPPSPESGIGRWGDRKKIWGRRGNLSRFRSVGVLRWLKIERLNAWFHRVDCEGWRMQLHSTLMMQIGLQESYIPNLVGSEETSVKLNLLPGASGGSIKGRTAKKVIARRRRVPRFYVAGAGVTRRSSTRMQ